MLPAATSISTLNYITLVKAALQLPGRDGKPINPATLTRWAIDGIRLANGERLRLRAHQVGSRWMTTAEWLHDFIEARTAASMGEVQFAERSPAERRRAADHARAEFDAIPTK